MTGFRFACTQQLKNGVVRDEGDARGDGEISVELCLDHSKICNLGFQYRLHKKYLGS